MLEVQATLVIAEAWSLFRAGLVALFRAEPDFTVVGEAGDADTARWLCARLQPDLILLHANLPDDAHGDTLEVVAGLRVACPQARIVVLGAAEERATAIFSTASTASTVSTLEITAAIHAERRRALELGAVAYALPSLECRELMRVARAALTGHHAEARAVPRPSVTEREKAVIALVAQGLCNKEIAHRLGISTQTVKNHVSHLLEKLALADRTQLAVYALEHPSAL